MGEPFKLGGKYPTETNKENRIVRQKPKCEAIRWMVARSNRKNNVLGEMELAEQRNKRTNDVRNNI
jgi:hypothetical protein